MYEYIALDALIAGSPLDAVRTFAEVGFVVAALGGIQLDWCDWVCGDSKFQGSEQILWFPNEVDVEELCEIFFDMFPDIEWEPLDTKMLEEALEGNGAMPVIGE